MFGINGHVFFVCWHFQFLVAQFLITTHRAATHRAATHLAATHRAATHRTATIRTTFFVSEKMTVQLLLKQGRIHGYPSRVRVGKSSAGEGASG